MKSLSNWTVRLTLAAATLAILLAANRPAGTAETATVNPENPAPPDGNGAILATKPATGVLPANYKPSASLSDVMKLAQAGVSEDVLLTYVNNSNKAFNPTPEDIIFLNDLGVSEAVIKALINAKGDANATKPAPAVEPPAAIQPPAAAQTPVLPEPPVPNGVADQPAYAPAPAPTQTGSEVVITAPAQVATVSYFYDTLAPYGNWVNVAGSGWCWQPTVAVVNPSWRPYCDRGRWVDSNVGWYWQSDYSWGWTAFHYGRWQCHARAGWLWTPDTVWAPAWVSWRYNNSYCGWAPLPPAAVYRPAFGFSYYGGSVGIGFDFGLSFNYYNFVPIGRVCARTPNLHVVAPHQTRTVYNNTTVNNTYITGNNNTVINQGVARDTIVKATKTPITRVTVKDALVRNSAGTNPDRITKDRNQDVIYKPILAKADVQQVTEQLRRARDPRTTNLRGSAGVPVSTPGQATTVSTTPPATPAPDTKAKTIVNRGSSERIAELIDQSRKKSKGNAPTSTSVNTGAPATTTATQPTATAPKSKPAISDQHLSRERVNQLVEEAKAKARERELSYQRTPAVTSPRTAPVAPVAKTELARQSVTLSTAQPQAQPSSRQTSQPVQRSQPGQPRPQQNAPLAKADPARQSVTIPMLPPQVQPTQPVQRSQPNQARNQPAEVLRERIQSLPAYQQYQQRSQSKPAPQTHSQPPQTVPAQTPAARPSNNERGGSGNPGRELSRGNSSTGRNTKDN